MNQTSRTSQFALTRIDPWALLGIRDPDDGADWSAIRAAQLNAGSQLALFSLGANVVGAAMVALMFAERVSVWLLALWCVVVAAVAAAVTLRRLGQERPTATPSETRRTAVDGAALALTWSVPPLLFAPGAPTHNALGLWVVLSILMTASATALAGLPLATISFLGILGGAVALASVLQGATLAAGAALLFTAIVAYNCFSRGKALVMIRAGELALAERDETVSLLLREFESSEADWLWEIDAARRICRASPRFAFAVGVEPKSLNNLPFLQVLAGSTWEAGNFAPGLRELSEKLKTREAFRDLLLAVHVNGEQRWWQLSASPRFDDRGHFCGFRGVSSDVTEARNSADKISRMARYDTLTGLPNRLLINETLGRAMAEAEKWSGRCAFMMIDLDRFKAVNDTLGHPIGDRLLGRVAERLGQLMTENEMIGRLGGDEFAVVVKDANDQQRLEKLALTIIKTLSAPYEVDQHTLFIGCSVGMAIGPRDGRTAEMLIRSADLALYRSKDAGGGTFHSYEPQLHVQAEERRVLEMALRSAIEAGQLYLQYQPVVALASETLAGFEALLRWNHPDFGEISPGKFIPLAEEARLIAPIGEWVLRTACAEAARWDVPARVAVNVSPEQLHNPNFVTSVVQALAQSGLPPERLELEVTESVFLREGTGAVQTLDQIVALGVRLSLDDFGTGYSSLGYLNRTKFSTIKIDRSFVTAAARGVAEAIAIIRAVVALADGLKIETTAEGVEREDELSMVRDLGCSKVQGFFYGRPLPVEEARRIAQRPARTASAA